MQLIPIDLARPVARRRRPVVVGLATAAVVCIVYLVLRPPSIDFASGNFRAGLFDRGAHLWNNLWFGGHPLPGYGVVSPWLGAVLGVVPVAIVSTIGATWAFALLCEGWTAARPDLPDPSPGVALFACCCAINLYGGRLTFLPSVLFGTLALLALQRNRRWLLVICAALCGLSSPVGALSLAVIFAAMWFARSAPRRLLVVAAIAAGLPIGILIVSFPEGGWYPFTSTGLGWMVLSAAVVGWCGRRHVVVRSLVLVYLAVALLAFVVRSPLGGNVLRLGWLLAGPAAVLTLRRHRRQLVPLFIVLTLAWTGSAIALAADLSNPSADPAFYDPLAAYLQAFTEPIRVEVVPTSTYEQADSLAIATTGIARGWERQIDRELNPIFYGEQLTEDNFHAWLLDHAVSLVALPLRAVSSASADEAAIVASRPEYLREVWSNPDWRVFRVIDAEPLADHGARVTDVQPESLTIEATRSGWTEVRYRFTELYRVTDGDACIQSSPDGWIQLLVQQPGTIHLAVALDQAMPWSDAKTCGAA